MTKRILRFVIVLYFVIFSMIARILSQMKTAMPFSLADYQELLTTFAGLDSGEIIFDANKYKSLWNFPVDDVYWEMDKRKFLVSQELYERIFNDYAGIDSSE